MSISRLINVLSAKAPVKKAPVKVATKPTVKAPAAKSPIKTDGKLSSRSIKSLNENKGYSSYSAAISKLQKIIGDNKDNVNCFVAINEHGKYIPVAVGEIALDMGLHRAGIYTTN